MKRTSGAGSGKLVMVTVLVAGWALATGTVSTVRAQQAPGTAQVQPQVSQIQMRLQKDPALKDNRIEVTVNKGIATLKGMVDTDAEKAEASRLASVSGIVGIDNRLEVGSAGLDQAVSDSALTANIKEKLEANEMNRFDGVAVTSHNGVVTLTGSVQSETAMKKVLDIAHDADGVTQVENNLTVAAPKQY
jgi:osmotically-inducible protein OsmY